tara:strand:+ start:3919 stop:4155 length:237 start_codon:yes stop_codon:yes gene_type:complete
MDKTLKTPEYQRRAYNNYIERKKADPEKWNEFKGYMKVKQNNYYQKNKEKILAKKKAKYAEKKKLKELESNDLGENSD